MNDFEKGVIQGKQEIVDNICKALSQMAKEIKETKGRYILDRKLPNK